MPATNKKQCRARLPEMAKVKIIRVVAGARELKGKTGIALAGQANDAGEWTYVVLIEGIGETHILPGSALEYHGEAIPHGQVYNGKSIRVRVNRHGAGTIVPDRNIGKQSRKTA
jgi:hypothetical protein